MSTLEKTPSLTSIALVAIAGLGIGIAAGVAYFKGDAAEHNNHSYIYTNITPKNTWFINPFQQQEISPGINYEVGVCKICGQQTHLAQIGPRVTTLYLLPKIEPNSSIQPGKVLAVFVPTKNFLFMGTNYNH